MKVGDLVESRHPRMHSFGYGIILSIGRIKHGPPRCTVYWLDESKSISGIYALDLWKVE